MKEDEKREEGKAPREYTPYDQESLDRFMWVLEEAQAKYEYRSGEIEDMAGGSPEHALITMNFASELKSQLRAAEKPCRVYSSDLMLHSWQQDAFVFPDVTAICGAPEVSEASDKALTNPALVVEVLSPSTEYRDRHEKFEIYSKFHTLKVYILVCQDRQEIEQCVRDGQGFWYRTLHDGRNGKLRIRSFGIELDWDAIYDGLPHLPRISLFPDEDCA